MTLNAVRRVGHWHEPFRYELNVSLEGEHSLAATGALIEAGRPGWEVVDDDGWRVDAWWSQARVGEHAVFLAAAVTHVNLVFCGWDSPVRRPASRR